MLASQEGLYSVEVGT